MSPRYIKLAAVYFFYFASLGIYLPYWAPYLNELGFSAVEIGQLLAVALGTKLFAPYIWGWVADHTGHRLRMLKIAATLAVVFYTGLLFRDDYLWLFAFLLLFSFFWNAMLPQLENITFDSLGHAARHYSRIRLWGSIGFIIFALVFAPVVTHYGLKIVPYLILCVLIAMWFVILFSHDRRVVRSPPLPITQHLLRREMLALLALCFLMQLTHGPYYSFFSIYMHDAGYSETAIGVFWALGVSAEVVIFIFIPRLLPRWGAPALLSFSMSVTALRWVLISQFPQQLPLILFAQTLHAVTFGVYHAAAIHLIDRWFPGSLQGRGQAVYSGVSFGLGGALGSLFTGYLWEFLNAAEVFMIAGMIAGAGVLLTLPLYRMKARH